MATSANVPEGVNVKHAYQTSFGSLADGTQYAGYTVEAKSENYKQDLRPELLKKFNVGMKAIDTTAGGAGTAGYGLIPVYVDPEIVDRSRKFTPLTEIMPRVSNQGMYADFNVITAKGGAFTAAEDASLTETDTTYSRVSVGIKFLYAVGRVTGPSQAATPSYMLTGFQPSGTGLPGSGFSSAAGPNSLQREVLVKARELKELEESLLVNGDAGTDSTQFNGIVITQGTTNKVDKNTTALDLSDLNLAIRYAYDDGGRPNFGVASSDTYNDILDLLQAKIGFMQATQSVFWGFSTVVYNSMVGQIPIIPSMYLSNTSGSKSVYFLDLSVWEVRVLQDMTYEKLAKTNDSDKFMLKMYECLICRAPTFNAWVGEIA